MARSNLITIGGEYLTTTGLAGGSPCRNLVSGLPFLRSQFGGNTVVAMSGKPRTFLVELGDSGPELEILMESTMPVARLDSVIDLVNNALAVSQLVNVTVDGDLGAFDLECMPQFSEGEPPVRFSGRFRNGHIYDVSFHFVIDSINTP